MLKQKLRPIIVKNRPKRPLKKIVFIDRDGVINRFPGVGFYLTRLEDFQCLSGAAHAVKHLNQAGFEVNVISNQGCISHEYITLRELSRITEKMFREMGKVGAEIHGVYYCPHQTSDRCQCKKPNVVLFKKALRGRRFDLREVFFIGDSKEDVQAAKNLGCQSMLVLSGRTKKKDLKNFEPKPDMVKKNLLEATRWIVKKRS